MRIISDWGLVRIVSHGDPFGRAYDIVVETRALPGEEWKFYHGFNSLSDDYAYTNAKEAAGRAIKKVAEEIATKLQPWMQA